MTSKTNAARLLDTLGIPYQIKTYDVDPENLDGETVARKIGLPAEQVWKTLVVKGDRHGHAFAVVPVDAELDDRALARLTGDGRIELAPLKEVQPLTGYIRGGVTVLAAKKPFPVYVDELVILHEVISVSAGQRGAQLILRPDDYLRATGATTGAIAREKRRV